MHSRKVQSICKENKTHSHTTCLVSTQHRGSKHAKAKQKNKKTASIRGKDWNGSNAGNM